MTYILYATTEDGYGYPMSIGEYEFIDDITIRPEMFGKGVVITIEERQMFNREQYWIDRPFNVGSKRPKPTFTEIAGKHLKQFGGKIILLNRKQDRMKSHIRNDKKHRDDRTHDNNLDARTLHIDLKELGEYERILNYKEQA